MQNKRRHIIINKHNIPHQICHSEAWSQNHPCLALCRTHKQCNFWVQDLVSRHQQEAWRQDLAGHIVDQYTHEMAMR
jgi:hypothetical protein